MHLNPNFELRDVCGEKVIVAIGLENINFNKLISLNETSAFLYATAAESKMFEETDLVQALLERYEVDAQTAEHDVHEVLSVWKEIGLL